MEIFARGTNLPSSRIVVATQVVEKGITIPGIKCMIDSGRMIRNHRGVLCHVNINESTKIQRRGRLGRVDSGVYISMLPVREYTLIPYPDAELFLLDPSFFTDFYNLKGKLVDLETREDWLAIYPYLSISTAPLSPWMLWGKTSELMTKTLLRTETIERFKTLWCGLVSYNTDDTTEDLLDTYYKELENLRHYPKENIINEAFSFVI